MADYPNHSAHDDNVTMAPPDLSLLSAALPSVLRQRLASFRKSMLVGDLDGVYTASKSSKDCVYASESTLVPDGTGEKQGQIRVIEDELSRPSTSSSFSPITPEPRTPIDYGMVATAEDVNDSGVSWNRVSPGMCLLSSGLVVPITELLYASQVSIFSRTLPTRCNDPGRTIALPDLCSSMAFSTSSRLFQMIFPRRKSPLSALDYHSA